MIVSVSSRTDIPAFYGEWFRNRLNAGYCLSANAFNGAVYRIGLKPEEIDGFVFWTKNIGPFLPQLELLGERGFPFVVHHTVNGYPRSLELAIIPAIQAVEHLRFLAKTYGGKVGIWRYDPILISDLTDFDFHRGNFSRLARALSGAVNEAVVSYVQYNYRKTKRKMDRAAEQTGFHWEDPSDDRKREFLFELAAIGKENGITLRLCAQPQYLSPGIPEASCIDTIRLSEIAGRPIPGKKPGHRGEQCACDYSRDIGAYDTCLHGCTYCYAVADFRAARKNYRQHDPKAEWLVPPRGLVKKKPDESMPLFCWDRQDVPD